MKYKIQDIKLPAKTKLHKIEAEKKVVKREFRHSQESRDYSWGIWFVAGIAVLFLIFSVSLVFSRAKVTIDLKRADAAINSLVTLSKADGVPFEVASVTGEEAKNITSNTSQDFDRRAKGSVVLYNATNQAQKLLIETRLSTPSGLIFKTDKALTIPAAKGETPGSIEVSVTAEKPGTDYNIGLVDFKIVGFKGTAKYEKLYGRSKTAMQGGLVGKRYFLSKEEAEKTIGELETALKEKLLQQIALQIHTDFFIIPDYYFAINIPTTFESETAEVPIKVSGELRAVIINAQKFAGELAKKNIADFGDDAVSVTNLKELTFVLKNKDKLTDQTSSIDLNVSGNAKFVWDLDVALLKEKLAGQARKDFKDTLAEFKAIDRAELKVLPFWKQSLPANTDNIKLIVN